MNHFLSWSGWIPFSKLCYCAYLSHYIFLLSENGAVRTTGNLTQINVLRAFFANLVFTIIWSAVWSLCFEIPFMNIDRIFLSGRKRKSLENKDGKSTTCDNDKSQSKENPSTELTHSTTSSADCDFTASTTCSKDNLENAIVDCKTNATIADEISKDEERKERKKSRGNIYLVSKIERDEPFSSVNIDVKKSNYIDRDDCYDFSESSLTSPAGKELLSINIINDDTEWNILRTY